MTNRRDLNTDAHHFTSAAAHRLDLTDPATLQALWELQRAAYAVEAELIGFDGIPPMHETLQELHGCGEAFLGLDDEIGLAGALSWRLPDHTLDICRLIVHPRTHRRGIATALLDSLDAAEPTDLTVVSTATANLPAIALYQRRGFVRTAAARSHPASRSPCSNAKPQPCSHCRSTSLDSGQSTPNAKVGAGGIHSGTTGLRSIRHVRTLVTAAKSDVENRAARCSVPTTRHRSSRRGSGV